MSFLVMLSIERIHAMLTKLPENSDGQMARSDGVRRVLPDSINHAGPAIIQDCRIMIVTGMVLCMGRNRKQ